MVFILLPFDGYFVNDSLCVSNAFRICELSKAMQKKLNKLYG